MDRDSTIAKFQSFVDAEGETLGRLLFWAERRVVEATLTRPEARAGNLTLAQFSALQQLCLGSTRLTELGIRLGLTKQAVGQIVDTLEQKGLVRRTPDPTDGRAKIIGYTKQGFALIDRLIDATLAAERDIARAIGPRDLATLKATLARIAADAPDA